MTTDSARHRTMFHPLAAACFASLLVASCSQPAGDGAAAPVGAAPSPAAPTTTPAAGGPAAAATRVQFTPPADAAAARKVLDELDFVKIAAGSFEMGGQLDELGVTTHEGPPHKVEITRSFELAKYELTQAQWQALMGNNPSQFTGCGNDCPVEKVSWWDAAFTANLLSRLTGAEECYDLQDCGGTPGIDYECTGVQFKGLACTGYRLPTEAEWEYAARAGTTGVVWTGKVEVLGGRNAPDLDPISWYGGNSAVEYEEGRRCDHWPETQYKGEKCGTHPVGKKQPNPWGLHDMIGNVYEWTHDWYGTEYYTTSPAIDPIGPETSMARSARGCGFHTFARYCRASRRIAAASSAHLFIIGIRLARTV